MFENKVLMIIYEPKWYEINGRYRILQKEELEPSNLTL
jgi:hypothetical protein